MYTAIARNTAQMKMRGLIFFNTAYTAKLGYLKL